MGNVAMNLVATMMQKNFSNNSYLSPSHGAKTNSFTQVLDNVKKSPYETLKHYEPKDFNNRNNIKSKRDIREVTKRPEKAVKNQFKENLEQLNEIRKNKVKTTDNTANEAIDETKMVDNKIVDELANTLNMTTDEIINLLNELGLTVMDLFDTDNLKMFITESMDLNNPLELLTTEDGMSKLSESMEALDKILRANPEMINELAQLSSKSQGDVQSSKQNEFLEILNNLQDSTGGNQTGSGTSGQGASAETEMGQSAQVRPAANSGNITTGFEGILNQVVTQKTETIIMNGQVQTIQTEVTAKDIFDQIVTGMKVKVTESKSNVLLQLNPQHLGKIGVNLMNDNGVVTGHFVAESEAVKEVIEANLSSLKNQLQNQGIDVSEIKVTVGNASEFLAGEQDRGKSSMNQNKSKRNKRHVVGNISRKFADKVSEEILEEENSIIHENSSIELHA